MTALQRKPIDPDKMKSLFDYNPETGELLWRDKRGPVNAGDVAGWSYEGRGDEVRWYVETGGKSYLRSRIVWAIMTGTDPGDMCVDHINGDTTDDRFANLRLATLKQNNHNSSEKKNNKAGLKGVFWDEDAGMWGAAIRANDKAIKLGVFKDKEAAYAVRLFAERILHGEFGYAASRRMLEDANE